VSAHMPRRIWVQNALNLYLEHENGSDLDISDAVALINIVTVAVAAVETILNIGLAALFLSSKIILI
jgi:hypothetical protein